MPPIERRRKTKSPCPGCFLHPQRCICARIPKLDLRTRVLLVAHYKELKRTTNTGRLAVRALSNSELIVRGLAPLDLSASLDKKYRSVLFFPSESSLELTRDWVLRDPRPIQLIVPDGNWRQASKVSSRHRELLGFERVQITTPNLGTQHLRAETSEFGMSTLEAIAKALGIIEGEAVQRALTLVYQAKLEQTLRGRGQSFSPAM